ncbi:hypothetical protein NEOLI_003989 [Neolecta irregularis DAH-3]|uniref:Uncharacterized protein n=1 Tax=Neolecta irregularis (strain DAH-3) TaxID=1198029 RepID=A0A1U7LKX6_NEOID|nr:hypothetical protein NEOLI_003989 [Neolecta irregularis DAH-3]|eukprot:OLL23304.1 hypothetical protein NEOLI_003989 [Neolecta irregularis DAH-3]
MLRRSSFALQNEQQAQVGQPTPASDEQSMSTPPGSPSSLTESNLVTLTPPSTISPRYRRNSIRHTSFVENIVYTQAPKSNPSVVSTPARTVNARRSTISSLSSLRNTMQDMFLDPPPDFALKDSPAKKSQLLFKANELANSLARDVATVTSRLLVLQLGLMCRVVDLPLVSLSLGSATLRLD